MENLNRRYLCWDDKLIEKSVHLHICAHKPEKKNVALLCDDEWEGECNGYGAVIKTPNGYFMYYRASGSRYCADGSGLLKKGEKGAICLAQSQDGIHFTKPDLGIHQYNGSKHNNIIFTFSDRVIDNCSFFYDENPACPKEEKFKALMDASENGEPRLEYFASGDGIHFTPMYKLGVQGTMDSYNVVVWDKKTKQYFLFHRAFHEKDGTDRLTWEGVNFTTSIRDVRVATSKDFRNWTPHGRIQFEEGQEEYPLYTNQILKYYRDNSTFIGFPTRYCDRVHEKRNFDFMPIADYREKITQHYGREGTALTDCVIMTSSDGFTFNRRDEAFFTPGPEHNSNWWYGNCYPVYGMLETKAEETGAANEISIYLGENYRIKNVNFRRYTLRLDGFFSWYGAYKGGEILTKSIKIDGEQMQVNFASSAIGGMKVRICDVDGNFLDGYESYVMFGDSVERPVEFEKPLSELKGKSVKLHFTLKDTHLYSFIIK